MQSYLNWETDKRAKSCAHGQYSPRKHNRIEDINSSRWKHDPRSVRCRMAIVRDARNAQCMVWWRFKLHCFSGIRYPENSGVAQYCRRIMSGHLEPICVSKSGNKYVHCAYLPMSQKLITYMHACRERTHDPGDAPKLLSSMLS